MKDLRMEKYEVKDHLSRENYVHHALELLLMQLLLDGVDSLGSRWGADLRVVHSHFPLWRPIPFVFSWMSSLSFGDNFGGLGWSGWVIAMMN